MRVSRRGVLLLLGASLASLPSTACFSAHCTSEAPLCVGGASRLFGPAPPTLEEKERARRATEAAAQRDRHDAFVAGALCGCRDPTCGAGALATAYCGRRGRDCVAELLMQVTGGAAVGGVRLLPGEPRVFERLGPVLSADGTFTKAILNHVPVDVRGRTNLELIPVGPDLGARPSAAPFRVTVPSTGDAHIEIDALDYVCASDAPE